MRKEARKEHVLDVAEVNGYHHGSHENYLVFASDRPNKADRNYHLLSDGSLPSMMGLEVETQNFAINNQTVYCSSQGIYLMGIYSPSEFIVKGV